MRREKEEEGKEERTERGGRQSRVLYVRFRRKDKRKVGSEGMGITQEIEASVCNLSGICIFHLESACNLVGICLQSIFSTWNLLGICLESACNQYFHLESTWNLLGICLQSIFSSWNLPGIFPGIFIFHGNLLGICLESACNGCCNMLATEQSHAASKKTCSFPNPALA